MGPYPDIEDCVELDFAKLRPGRVAMPEVLEIEAKL